VRLGDTALASPVFVAIDAFTADAAEYFDLPRDRTVIIGYRIPP
jgi:hypothetical protein